MKEIVFDTNFILNCLKEKVDFLEVGELGELVLPLQVINELEKIANSEKNKLRERNAAELALQIIEKNKEKFKIVELEKKFVDKGIVNYVEGKSKEAVREIVVASFDKELKNELKGKVRFLGLKGKNFRVV